MFENFTHLSVSGRSTPFSTLRTRISSQSDPAAATAYARSFPFSVASQTPRATVPSAESVFGSSTSFRCPLSPCCMYNTPWFCSPLFSTKK